MTTTPRTTARDYFAGRPEARTSYTNQAHLAVRDLGGDTLCIHNETLANRCVICRASNSVLLPG